MTNPMKIDWYSRMIRVQTGFLEKCRSAIKPEQERILERLKNKLNELKTETDGK
jgi:hypothetical protein